MSSCRSSNDLQHIMKSYQNHKFWYNFFLFFYFLVVVGRKKMKNKIFSDKMKDDLTSS